MKKYIKHWIILVIGVLGLSSLARAKDMVFMQIDITEAMMLLDIEGTEKLDLDATNSIVTDIGYKMDVGKESLILFFYEMNYDGPGIKGSSNKGFDSRSIDQIFFTKWMTRLSPDLQLSLKADFFYEFYRIGKNEDWEDGLYNFGKVGGGPTIDYRLNSKNTISMGLELHYYWFPNYEDLSREAIYALQDPSSNSFLSEDAVNQNFFQLGLYLGDRWRINKKLGVKAGYYFFYRAYSTLTVDTDSLIASNEKQTDYQHELSLKVDYAPVYSWRFGLDYRFQLFKSNYNYRHLADLSNLSGSVLYEDYSSNSSHKITVPISYVVSPRSIWTLSGTFEYKKYSDRPAKNKEGEFKTEAQKHLAYMGSLAWTYKKTRYFSVTPQYVFRYADSNNSSETDGYNYMVHYLGVRFSFEY